MIATPHSSTAIYKTYAKHIPSFTHIAPASLLISRADNPAGFLAILGLISPVLTSPYLGTARSVLLDRTKTGSSAKYVSLRIENCELKIVSGGNR